LSFFLDANEAAEFLKVTKKTIYDWVHRKKVPYRKHGRKLVFSQEELIQWSNSTLQIVSSGKTTVLNSPLKCYNGGLKDDSLTTKYKHQSLIKQPDSIDPFAEKGEPA
jgi:excisionase family DNA binding protein